jgi:hypothetical protein
LLLRTPDELRMAASLATEKRAGNQLGLVSIGEVRIEARRICRACVGTGRRRASAVYDAAALYTFVGLCLNSCGGLTLSLREGSACASRLRAIQHAGKRASSSGVFGLALCV